MKKIPSLFVRDYTKEVIGQLQDGRVMTTTTYSNPGKGKFLATDEVTPGCEWVINGEGVATRKWDGTAVLFIGNEWFKRYDAKHGKTPPPDFFEAQPEPDPITGHWPGWVPVVYSDNADKYISEAILSFLDNANTPKEGMTYEAIGPKINGNKDRCAEHCLKQHGKAQVFTKEWQPREFKSIRNQLEVLNIEGFVYHHPDGRMCKVKRSDFGLHW